MKMVNFCSMWYGLGQPVSTSCAVSTSGWAGARGYKMALGSCLMPQLGWFIIWRLAGKTGPYIVTLILDRKSLWLSL